MIPYGRQEVTEADRAAVEAVLRSDWLTQGPMVPQFEEAVARYCGVPHAVAVNSATSALHLACLVLGLGPGDWLWTSPNSFVASANCARYCGAQVDFVDIDPETYNLSVPALAARLEQAERLGRLPKIVVPVHFAGQPCAMPAIADLARRYGFRVIEDASHAIGATYAAADAETGSWPVGRCAHSDLTVFSFHPVKIITTGEGGMVTTQDGELAERLRRLRSHGITRDPRYMEGVDRGEGLSREVLQEPWYYQQIELGFNYRMTDMAAALGLSQLQRLEAYLRRRTAIARRYAVLLKGLPVQRPYQTPDNRSALHLYPLQLQDPALRLPVFLALRAAGIGVNVHYIPIHTQPDYTRLGFRPGDFPQAERYYQRALSIPLHAGLTDAQQDQVVDALRHALETCTGLSHPG